MLRQDFIDDITTWGELIDFCNDEDCDICEDIYSEDARDEDIDRNSLVEWARGNSWQDLLNILRDIPTGSDYYYCDDYGDWYEADDNMFEDRKRDVLEWMDDGGYWDDEDEDEEIFDEIDTEFSEDEEDLEPIEPEDISFTDLLTSCSQKLKTIEDTQEQEAQEEAENFDSFVMSFTVTEERR